MKYAMVLLVVLGCHRIPIEERLNARGYSWVGKTELELIQAWGAPKETTEVNKHKVITYELNDVRAESYRVFGRVKNPIRCKVIFTVEVKTEVVKSGSWEGDKKLCDSYMKQARGPVNDIAVD